LRDDFWRKRCVKGSTDLIIIIILFCNAGYKIGSQWGWRGPIIN
jgi:hypothetical protein